MAMVGRESGEAVEGLTMTTTQQEQAAHTKGLRIPRRWTRTTVHPYDDITWELRSATITNEKGEVVFEQKDVEVPSCWSQLATNVVVSKYFRGALGTPSRERSVKQLVSRVANTITEWGVKDGYFLSPDDAEAFRAELTYLLVQQHAAFNSPVWFNVGIEPRPQCSACQPYHALINTADGLMPIGEIVERRLIGLPVYDGAGLTQVVAVKHNGRKPVYRVQLNDGFSVEATGDHLVCAHEHRRTHRVEWRRVDELRPGMTMRVYAHGQATVTAPAEAKALSEAALAGWLQADGFVGQYEHGTNQSLTIEFMTVDAQEHAWVMQHLDIAFPGQHYRVSEMPTDDPALHCRRIRLDGEALRPFVETYGLLARGQDLRVPRSIWTAPNDAAAAYVKSLFQSDGYAAVHVPSSHVAFAVTSKAWAEEIQRLLTRFGIYARLRQKKERRPDRYDMWELGISIRSEREAFQRSIGFISERKNAKLRESLRVPGKQCPDVRYPTIVSIEPLGEMDVYDLQTVSGCYLTNSVLVHNCFILSVDDTMESILEWYRNEGMIFKYGSGSGLNVSPIRSARERLAGGGTASGPVSFMRAADASAGVIKSGGKTRRAAKMVVLNADHPDVKQFILCKWKEEEKAHKLIDLGYDPAIDGEAYGSVFFQNANNSVRVTDEFMRRALADEEWELRAVTTGETLERVKAKELLRLIAEATWHCGDPGMQFDTTINDWHTCPTAGRINASNPCFTGDALVYTDKGLVPFRALLERVELGEPFRVFTHDATHLEHPASTVSVTSPTHIMSTGIHEVYCLRFSNGAEVKATANHRFFTANRGMVAAKDLQPADDVRLLDQPVELLSASLAIDLDDAEIFRSGWGDRDTKDHTPVDLPRVWTSRLAEYVGYLVGDGSVVEAADAEHRLSTASVVCGNAAESDELVPHFRALFAEMGIHEPQLVTMPNATVQLRVNRTPVVRFLKQLGVQECRAHEKVVPQSVFQTATHIIAGFLRGLFTADGCVYDGKTTRYVGLGSTSRTLLVDAQRLLLLFGIHSRIYRISEAQQKFSDTKEDGTHVKYISKPLYDLRVSGPSMVRFKEHVGFLTTTKQAKLDRLITDREFHSERTTVRLVEMSKVGYESTYNLTEPKNHSYIVNGIVVANCSEYMHLDNSACNLASINLLKFIDDEGNVLTEQFRYAVRIMTIAQDSVVQNSSYPTAKIESTARAYRELGLGYANLGALLMSLGLAYDSEEGRAWAGTLTALLCGTAYEVSGEIAQQMGPYAGFAMNREPQLRVLRKHRAQVDKINHRLVPQPLLQAATRAWDESIRFGEAVGVRNSQVTVLAPTGCLVGSSLIVTDKGVVRLNRLGKIHGAQWQDVSFRVLTDQGERPATRFYINGPAATRRIRTEAGYEICGTLHHRVKVVDPITNAWVWRRFEELASGDLVPLAMNTVFGDVRHVALPPLGEPYWASDPEIQAPGEVTADLAEFVGYFMGDGSLHSKGLRFCVTAGDEDVVERLCRLAWSLFHAKLHVELRQGYVEVSLHSVALAMWWEACGFAKHMPTDSPDHRGKGYQPHIPDAILATNDRLVYSAFLRGLFEADGSVTLGVPSFSTAHAEFAREVATLLLALGYPTTAKLDQSGWGAADVHGLRLRNISYNESFLHEIGFLGKRKAAALETKDGALSGKRDYVFLPDDLIDELVPVSSRHHNAVLMSIRRHGGIPRQRVVQLYEETRNDRLAHALQFFYDRVSVNEDGGLQPTYDLSVPDNTTYLANGFVSHNTIAFLMDCDTTGIEPDIALIKYKRLVGGGMLKIVNQTVPRALKRLGYAADDVDAILKWLDEKETIEGAPGLKAEHLPIFDCAFRPVHGTRFIHYMGHVRMMGAAQPFISGAISKTVNLPQDASVEDIMHAYTEAWRLGIKALAIYRDGSKRVQPLSTGKKENAAAAPAGTPYRRRLPDERQAITHKFSIGGHEGYLTVGLFEDGQPGEIFIVMSKEGSTLSGVMDCFATTVSLSLQYGVPLKVLVNKFNHVRFEPSGVTNTKDIRFAKSVIDYIFRWLALKFLPAEEAQQFKVTELPGTKPAATAGESSAARAATKAGDVSTLEQQERMTFVAQADAPACHDCGSLMVRNGNCYKCGNCGSTSGCS